MPCSLRAGQALAWIGSALGNAICGLQNSALELRFLEGKGAVLSFQTYEQNQILFPSLSKKLPT
jgi:hypothetical protein